MHKLFNELNIGYSTNSLVVKVAFKKKYIFVLEKLLRMNCISSYTIDGFFILVTLRYFQNKPLIFFLVKSKGGNKLYKKYKHNFKNNNKSFFSHLSLFFTNYGLLTSEELIYAHTGGEHVVDIFFLDNK